MMRMTIFTLSIVATAVASGTPPVIPVVDGELREAILQAPAHATIVADPTRQIEVDATISITKPLTIVGLNARIQPGLGRTPLIEVVSEGFTFRNFKLEGNVDSVAVEDRAPLVLIRKGRFVIENGETNNSAKDGIMITPTEEHGSIEHGVIRNITGRGTARDVISIGGKGHLGLFVRHLVVENIRGYHSSARGAVEVSDGSEYITVRDVYAESSVYAVDVQDHKKKGQVNRHVIIDGVHVVDCHVAVRTANRDLGHDGLTIRNVSGERWRTDSRFRPVHVRNTKNVLIENVRIHGSDGGPAVFVQNCENVTLRDVTVTESRTGKEGAVVLEDVNCALIDGVVIRGDVSRPRYGIVYRIRSDRNFAGLRISNADVEKVEQAGILLENVSETGRLTSKVLSGNLGSVHNEFK